MYIFSWEIWQRKKRKLDWRAFYFIFKDRNSFIMGENFECHRNGNLSWSTFKNMSGIMVVESPHFDLLVQENRCGNR